MLYKRASFLRLRLQPPSSSCSVASNCHSSPSESAPHLRTAGPTMLMWVWHCKVWKLPQIVISAIWNRLSARWPVSPFTRGFSNRLNPLVCASIPGQLQNSSEVSALAAKVISGVDGVLKYVSALASFHPVVDVGNIIIIWSHT